MSNYDRPGLVVYVPETPRTGSPPRKYNKEIHAEIINLLKEGLATDSVARACGIDAATFRKWYYRGINGDPWLEDFARDVDLAVGCAQLQVERVAVAAAREDAKAAFELLERRDPKQWSKNQNAQMTEAMTRFLEECAARLPEKWYVEVLAIAAGKSSTGALSAADSEDEDGDGTD